MGIVLLISWLLPANAACPDRLQRLDLIDEAERALVEADLAGADQKLREIEAALGCGALAEPELLGRMWLVEGAWLTLQGDAEAARDSWRAAARVAPGRWLEDYGARLRTAYESANAAPSAGNALITVDPPLFRYIGAIDGQVVRFPASVPPGLHLVQVGVDEDSVAFSRILLAFPDTPAVVVTSLVEPTGAAVAPAPVAPVVEPAVVRPPRIQPKATLHIAAGAGMAIGQPATTTDGDEPGAKVLFPVETGAVVRPRGKGWIRGAVAAAPLVGGAFVYEDGFGETATPTALGFHAAGGLIARQGDMGVLLGYQWPGRAVVRGVLAGALGRSPFAVEGRVGLNIVTSGPPEPAFEFLLAFVPRLIEGDAPVPVAQP